MSSAAWDSSSPLVSFKVCSRAGHALPQTAFAHGVKAVLPALVGGLCVLAAVARASGRHRGFGKLQLKGVVSAQSQPAAEAGNGGVGHLTLLRQFRDGHVLGVDAVRQHVVGHLLFRIGQLKILTADGFKKYPGLSTLRPPFYFAPPGMAAAWVPTLTAPGSRPAWCPP